MIRHISWKTYAKPNWNIAHEKSNRFVGRGLEFGSEILESRRISEFRWYHSPFDSSHSAHLWHGAMVLSLIYSCSAKVVGSYKIAEAFVSDANNTFVRKLRIFYLVLVYWYCSDLPSLLRLLSTYERVKVSRTI